MNKSSFYNTLNLMWITLRITFIIVGIGLAYQGSNPEQGCSH